MPRDSKSQPSSKRVQTKMFSHNNNTIDATPERFAVPRDWHCKSPTADQSVGSVTGCGGDMLQRWVEEAPAAQPYHMIAEVVSVPETNHQEGKIERTQVGSQVAEAGSQGGGQ